jgi:uncharacterized protein (DUF4415 family)
MRREGNIVSGTAEEIRQMLADEGGGKTDWARAMAIPQEEVERMADEEDGPFPEGWVEESTSGAPEFPNAARLRLSRDVLRWFKAQGPGYQERINAVLLDFIKRQEPTGQA